MLRTAIAIILLAAGVRAQQVGVPTGGTLGPSSNLSYASTLNSDKWTVSMAPIWRACAPQPTW